MDERIALILDTGPTKEQAEATARAMDRLKGSVHTTADTYEVLERQVGEYEVLERRVVQTTQTVVQAHEAEAMALQSLGVRFQHTNTAAAGVGRELGKDGSFGRGLLQASFAVQDFTSVLGTQGLGRAFASVQNNIPLLLASLGTGAGLAGVLSVVSVGIGLVYENWDKVTGLWKEGETAEEAKRVKDLAKATEELAAAGERMAKTPRPELRGAPRDIKRAVDAFGGPKVIQELIEALRARQGTFGEEADRNMAQTLFTNLMHGDVRATELLKDLDLRGPVGRVLMGGKTPAEESADKRQVQAEEERRQKDAEEKREAESRRQVDRLHAAGRRGEEEWERAKEQDRRDAEREAKGAEKVEDKRFAKSVDQLGAHTRGMIERMQAGRMAKDLAEQGFEASPKEVLDAVRRAGSGRERELAQYIQSVEEMTGGITRETMMLRMAAARNRAVQMRIQAGLEQSPLSSGLQR